MSLMIPKEYAPGLAALAALSDSEVFSFTKVLSEIPDTAHRPKEIAAFVAGRLPEFLPDKVDELVRALHSLYQARAATEGLIDQFVDDLADAVASSGTQELASVTADRSHFVEKMHKLLSIDGLSFLAKTNLLKAEHERLFHDAKILTDLRPVFHAPDEAPVDMIVEYTLKIIFHDGTRHHREIYMAIDAEDIARLKKAIDRAEKKAISLKSLVDAKGLAPLRSLTEA